jgi:hypothetical protein
MPSSGRRESKRIPGALPVALRKIWTACRSLTAA